jgi:hypothetical protein
MPRSAAIASATDTSVGAKVGIGWDAGPSKTPGPTSASRRWFRLQASASAVAPRTPVRDEMQKRDGVRWNPSLHRHQSCRPAAAKLKSPAVALREKAQPWVALGTAEQRAENLDERSLDTGPRTPFLRAQEYGDLRLKEDRMAIVDFVSGKAAEPITVRALVGERTAKAGDVLALAEHHSARIVDLKFTDLPGTWQHMGMALARLDEEALSAGIGFDGSSIRGSRRSTSPTCCCSRIRRPPDFRSVL